MSLTGQLDASVPYDKITSLLKNKTVEQDRSVQQQQQTQLNQTTGLQWAAPIFEPGQTVNQQSRVESQSQAKPARPELLLPSVDDLAILSTSASIKSDSVAVVNSRSYTNFIRSGFNMAALEETYREAFKKSKSHNLLLERFTANVKFSAVKTLFSLLGVSAAEQQRMQKEVRDEALAEIDSRLNNEWAYSKAMLDIVG